MREYTTIDCNEFDRYPFLCLSPVSAMLNNSPNANIIWNRIFRIAHSSRGVYRDGYMWCVTTYEDLQKEFPWLSASQIRKMILKLINPERLLIYEYFGDGKKWFRNGVGEKEEPPIIKPLLPSNAIRFPSQQEIISIENNSSWKVLAELFVEIWG